MAGFRYLAGYNKLYGLLKLFAKSSAKATSMFELKPTAINMLLNLPIVKVKGENIINKLIAVSFMGRIDRRTKVDFSQNKPAGLNTISRQTTSEYLFFY
jgi:hypothetical protein